MTCLGLASNGDTINVTAGTISSGTVMWGSSPCVTISGQSLAVTITPNSFFNLTPSTTCEDRITGFAFTGSSTDILEGDSGTNSTYRIDHNTFLNSALSVFVQVGGNGPGLLDHNTFTGGGASEEIHNFGAGSGNAQAGWTDNITPGGSQMVFVENNTFNCSSTTTVCSGIESYYGARTVLRHNTFNYTQIDQHGSSGSTTNSGSRWWEIYDNSFFSLSQNQCCFITLRSGSGVIGPGNTDDGTSTHGTYAGAINLYFDGSSSGFAWPGQWEVGSGINGYTMGHNSCAGGTLNSAPAYVFGNLNDLAPSTAVNSSGDTPGTSSPQANRDWLWSSTQPATMTWEEQSGDTCSTTYTYTSYTYPHPLDTSGATGSGLNGGVKITSGASVQ
jgi:hypothetical protein